MCSRLGGLWELEGLGCPEVNDRRFQVRLKVSWGTGNTLGRGMGPKGPHLPHVPSHIAPLPSRISPVALRAAPRSLPQARAASATAPSKQWGRTAHLSQCPLW